MTLRRSLHLHYGWLLLTCFLGGPVYAVSSDANLPIHIEGDQAEIDQNKETIVYTGAVEVIQGTLRVNGERMVVNVKDNQVQRIVTTGSPARYRQELDDNQGEVKAHANTIIYHTAQERVYLNGDAFLTQQGNQLKGESIRYNIVDGKVDASAGETDDKVKMTFTPEQNQ